MKPDGVDKQPAQFDPSLDAAIEELYRVFADYGLPNFTDPCRCCHTEEDERLIHSRPLRELGHSWRVSYRYRSIPDR